MINDYKKLKGQGKTTVVESQAAIPTDPVTGAPAIPTQYRVDITQNPVEHNITLEEAQKQADDANQLLADIKALQ